MRIVAISDTHCHEPELPEGDILIHAGDLTIAGNREETEAALLWLGKQALKFKHTFVVPGNHDWFLFHLEQKWGKRECAEFVRDYSGAVCLIDEPARVLRPRGSNIGAAVVTKPDIQLWCSPWTPWFYDWAYNAQRGSDIKQYWDMINVNTDILVTHGPPMGVLDWVGPKRAGCEELHAAVSRIRPKVHIFGHLHAAGGQRMKLEPGGTLYVNAALVDENYELAHEPQVIEL